MHKVFKAISSPHRLKILEFLCLNPNRSVASSMATNMGMELKNFCYHLSILKDANLIDISSHGRFIVPSAKHEEIAELGQFLIDLSKGA